ncbi:MAG: hypothetical protein R5N75_08350 [Cutibacterium granulosum]|uniref:hypothetical protein n=1 Tax=Cutibacterium granulosum TaxID=33011 RepID=UPI002B227C79|nr:hypothetical protein [Cutibacterium granulosum]MEA5660101.1 hypothetical protein [Cutibacterium granulosum]
MSKNGFFVSTMEKRYRRSRGAGYGPVNEMSDTYVEPIPWDLCLTNGIFRERETGRLWKYFRAPTDVQTEWLTDPMEALNNQFFMVDLIDSLAVITQPDSVRTDIRRGFHSQTAATSWSGIVPPHDFSPKHKDYMARVSVQFNKPAWNTYVGVELLTNDTFYQAQGVRENLQEWWNNKLHPEDTEWLKMEKDLADVNKIFARCGFTGLNFDENPDDYRNLTAWYGVDIPHYGVSKSLETTRAKETVDGMSMILPACGEVMFHALRPDNLTHLQDPLSSAMPWASPLYNPAHGVVCVNIRGEIRAPDVMDNLMGSRNERTITKFSTHQQETRARNFKENEQDISEEMKQIINVTEMGREATKQWRHAVVDNCEVVIGTKVPEPGWENELFQTLKNHHAIEPLHLRDRQSDALFSTLPAFPHGVMRIPRGNRARPRTSNVLGAGFIAMSGLYRSTRPAADSGIWLGLSPAGNEYREIYTPLDAASKYNAPPIILCSGRPGSGKTQTLIQIICQASYEGLPGWFLNLKKEGSLKPVFDLIGGYTISMNKDFLMDNPGTLDPKLFLSSPDDISALISDMLFSSMRIYSMSDASESAMIRAKISREILERCRSPYNRTTHDILFGNNRSGEERTEPLSYGPAMEWLSNALVTDPFWIAFVGNKSDTQLSERLRQGRSVLVEWDRSMSLPTSGKSPSEYDDSELSMVNSVSTVFKYATQQVKGTGGAVVVDESYPLRHVKSTMDDLDRAGREWRQANIALILASQNLTDWLGTVGDSSSSAETVRGFVSRYLIMAINRNNDADFEWFYELTNQPRSDAMRNFIANMGAKPGKNGRGNVIPRAWYHDEIPGLEWSGPVISGPFPERELNAARTDKEGQENRDQEMLKKDLADFSLEVSSMADFFAATHDTVANNDSKDANPSRR